MMVSTRCSTLLCVALGVFASQSNAEISTVDVTRGAGAFAAVAPVGLTPLTDIFDTGEDKTVNAFNETGTASVEINGLNKTSSYADQVSSFVLAPDSALAFGTGSGALNTSIYDPGFANSMSSGYGTSVFEWTFSVDADTDYSLDVALVSNLFGYSEFGVRSSG